MGPKHLHIPSEHVTFVISQLTCGQLQKKKSPSGGGQQIGISRLNENLCYRTSYFSSPPNYMDKSDFAKERMSHFW